MAILVCSLTHKGCGFIGKAEKFNKKGIWVYCPKCHGDNTLEVTVENILYLIKDDDSQKKAFDLLTSDQRQKLKDKSKNLSKLIIRPKSHSQEDDCLYPKCPNNKSTHEVTIGTIIIRFCKDANCSKFAIDIAKSSVSKNLFLKKN